jgi:hypothetical protein
VAAKRTILPLALFVFLGCHTPTFSPVDLNDSGWKTRSGQAIWKPDRFKPEIVGDLILSSDQSGNAYLEFSKAFPIVHARLAPNAWQIEFPPQNKRYAAPGQPPSRISWLQLLRISTGGEIAKGWSVSNRSESGIALSNSKTGELIEAHF